MPQPYIDTTGLISYREASGDGTIKNPYIPVFTSVLQGIPTVRLTGNLPVFATTPTFNIGTAPALTINNTSFTANAGTDLNTSLLALETGGNLAGINAKLPSNLTVTATRLLVDGSGVTQPISVASLPLPTGAATSSLQSTANTSLASIDTQTPALGQALAAASTPVVLPAAQITALTPPTTVGVNSLPALSTGSNAIGSITNTSFGISGTLPAFTNTPTFNIGTAPTIAVTGAFYHAIQPVSLSTNTPTLQASSAIVGKVGIDQTTPGTTNKVSIGNDGTVAISGNVAVTGNFYQATQPISVASLPLPTQASTSALQTTGNTSLATIATNTGNIPANLTVSSTRLLVDNSGVTQPVSGTITANLGTIAGVATATNQETTNTSLAIINSKIPALGQALAASSTPVVLTASQLSTLTPLASVGITGTLPAFAATPTFNIGTISTVASEATLSALNTKLPSNLTVTSTRLLVDSSGVTQPISAASLPLPTNAATSALQTTGNTSLGSIDNKTPALGQALAAGSTPVVLPAAQITALTPLSTIAATQSGNWNIGSITTLPSLPTGANTIGAISKFQSPCGD